jgi:hypothetical protein
MQDHDQNNDRTCRERLRIGAACAALLMGLSFSADARAQSRLVGTTAPVPMPAQGNFSQTVEGRDISGVWQMNGREYVANGRPVDQRISRTIEGALVPLRPEAQVRYNKVIEDERNGVPYIATQAKCLPHGMPQMVYAAPAPIQILQTPGQITFIHELGRHVRVVYMNEPQAEDPDPTFFGNSVGRWEGDELVVDTVGLTEKTELDRLGLPHSTDLHIVERVRLISPDVLEFLIRFEDPKTFTRPWYMRVTWNRQPKDVRVIEYVCADGNQNWPDANGNMSFPGADEKP